MNGIESAWGMVSYGVQMGFLLGFVLHYSFFMLGQVFVMFSRGLASAGKLN